MLLPLTLLTVFLVVVALAGYLSAVAWALRDARHSVSAIADGLGVVDGNLGSLAGALQRQEER
jgi:hypothetical protein